MLTYLQVTAVAKECAAAVSQGQWAKATDLWGDVENVVANVSANVNWYVNSEEVK